MPARGRTPPKEITGRRRGAPQIVRPAFEIAPFPTPETSVMTDHDHEDSEDPEDEGPDARARIAESLDGLLDKETLGVLLKEVLAVTKQARGWCPNCKKAVQVSISRFKGGRQCHV